jgi:excisionase family DNA binding protein
MENYSIRTTKLNDYFTAEEAAEVLGCHYTTVHRRIYLGDLEGLNMGGGHHRVSKKSVLDFKKRIEEKSKGREPGRRLWFPRRPRRD